MAVMEKYGEHRDAALTIRVIGIVSSVIALWLLLYPQLGSGIIQVFFILVLGVALLVTSYRLRRDSGATLAIATRGMVFGWLMVTSVFWGAFVFIPLINYIGALRYLWFHF